MEAPEFKEVIGEGIWEEKIPDLWICQSFGDGGGGLAGR